MFCTKCGMKLRAEDKFCARCGNAISRDIKPYEPARVEQAAAVEEPPLRGHDEKIAKESGDTGFEFASVPASPPTQEKGPLNVDPPSAKSAAEHEAGGREKTGSRDPESPEMAYAGLFTELEKPKQDEVRREHPAGQPVSQPEKRSKESETPSMKSEALSNMGKRTPSLDDQRKQASVHPISLTKSPEQPDHSNDHSVQAASQPVIRPVHTGGAAALQADHQPETHSPAPSEHPSQNPANFSPALEELLSVFAGENSEYYLASWRKPYSMNWAAFFLTIFWMGHRKMIAPMIITAGTYILAGLLIAATGAYWLTILAVPLFLTAIGFLGNRIYLSHAKEKISKVQSYQGSAEEKRQMLAMKGGTGPVGVFITFGVMIGYLLISVLLFSFL
ncbi:zinc-ribbon domain-containing protein [Bacillus sp. FJAT-42376]|uniref:zinc-ribbon domain-containing protein n=1 Tax=Bacillus sp. FJAT-42376 TaxID=2014076 RepID=UPI000F4F7D31|nr:zinc-ribbon domain-containing protein [Bacillus sp. FJAT-42376]AZB44822.1 zinc-ribbon domain-containing protein [Bacillus sp. FJAT-42376]